MPKSKCAQFCDGIPVGEETSGPGGGRGLHVLLVLNSLQPLSAVVQGGKRTFLALKSLERQHKTTVMTAFQHA